jgi:hypothetical protein
MSFDVYLQNFHRGEFAGIPRQSVRDVIGAHLTETEPDYWQLHYDDTNTCDIGLTPHDTDQNMVLGFTVHRPCADERLWDALASFLTLGDVALYFPGGRAPLVARSSVAEHLPPDMIEALGQPVVVTSGREIQHEIHMA